MLIVINLPSMLGVIMLNVIMLSVGRRFLSPLIIELLVVVL